ncbi:MAG: type II secretion system protein N [bacterium]
MLLRYGMRALQIALGVACLAVVYAGLAPVLKASSISATRLPPIEAPPTRDASPGRYAVIGTRNLFRTREAAAPTSVEEDLKESALQLKLCGTYAAQPSDRSVACIDDQTSQKRRAFRVGQDISPGVRLLAVERRRAVIDNRGAREQLTMEEPVGPDGTPAAPPRPQAAARVNPTRSARLSDRLKELRQRTPEVAQANSEAIRPKLQAALEGAQLSPVYDESGQFGGVKLTGIRPAGPFAGLPENTICFELNGARLDGVQALPQALMSGSTGQACLRCRQPDGVETMRCL